MSYYKELFRKVAMAFFCIWYTSHTHRVFHFLGEVVVRKSNDLKLICLIRFLILKHAPICKWCMVGCESKNEHQKEIGLRAQTSSTILDAIVNLIGWGTYTII